MYADDLAVMVSGSDVSIITSLLQEDMDRVNAEKLRIMWCYSDRAIPDLSQSIIKLSGESLKVVDEFNYSVVW